MDEYLVLFEDQYGRASLFCTVAKSEEDAERIFHIYSNNRRKNDVSYVEKKSDIYVHNEAEAIAWASK